MECCTIQSASLRFMMFLVQVGSLRAFVHRTPAQKSGRVTGRCMERTHLPGDKLGAVKHPIETDGVF